MTRHPQNRLRLRNFGSKFFMSHFYVITRENLDTERGFVTRHPRKRLRLRNFSSKCFMSHFYVITGENLDNREGQPDSTPLDKYDFEWTSNGV